MKKRKLLASLAAGALFGLFAAALLLSGVLPRYPIAEQDRIVSGAVVRPPDFSADSGFSRDPFYLTLSQPEGAAIYYTLDCSEPDEHSLPYEGPIWLADASQQENGFSARTDLSAGFRSDLIAQQQTEDRDPEYTVPAEKIDKCNVVRAVAIDRFGNRSETVTKSYFVGPNFEKYADTHIISLVADPADLFDYETGIYVTGKRFDDYLAAGEFDRNWQFWDANYRIRGKQSERGCAVAIFDREKRNICETAASVCVHGGYSRGALPRSLDLYAKANSEGKQTGYFPALFGNDYTPSALTLSSGGNRTLTKLNDVLMTDFVSDLGFAAMKYEPCVLFLEGEYWGFYWLTERYNEDYFSYYYDADPADLVMIKNGQVSVGKNRLLALYTDLVKDLTARDLSDEGEYQAACRRIDLDSFLNYYAVQIYIARTVDWPQSNYALWRTLDTGSGPYQDGKWRWMLFDSNSACMLAGLTRHDTLREVLETDALFAAFWENPSFRAAFQERILYVGDQVLNGEAVAAYIDEYQTRMDPLLRQSLHRFHGDSESTQTEYEYLFTSSKNFFTARKEYVETWFGAAPDSGS